MAQYKLEILPAAQKELASIPKQDAARIIVAIEALSLNPYPPGTKKMKGVENHWRIRVGNYRVIYSIFNQQLQIWVLRISDRKEAYR